MKSIELSQTVHEDMRTLQKKKKKSFFSGLFKHDEPVKEELPVTSSLDSEKLVSDLENLRKKLGLNVENKSTAEYYKQLEEDANATTDHESNKYDLEQAQTNSTEIDEPIPLPLDDLPLPFFEVDEFESAPEKNPFTFSKERELFIESDSSQKTQEIVNGANNWIEENPLSMTAQEENARQDFISQNEFSWTDLEEQRLKEQSSEVVVKAKPIVQSEPEEQIEPLENSSVKQINEMDDIEGEDIINDEDFVIGKEEILEEEVLVENKALVENELPAIEEFEEPVLVEEPKSVEEPVLEEKSDLVKKEIPIKKQKKEELLISGEEMLEIPFQTVSPEQKLDSQIEQTISLIDSLKNDSSSESNTVVLDIEQKLFVCRTFLETYQDLSKAKTMYNSICNDFDMIGTVSEKETLKSDITALYNDICFYDSETNSFPQTMVATTIN